MYVMMVGKLTYKYMVGPHSVGVITPSRLKYVIPITEVLTKHSHTNFDPEGHNDRVSPEAVAAYIIIKRWV